MNKQNWILFMLLCFLSYWKSWETEISVFSRLHNYDEFARLGTNTGYWMEEGCKSAICVFLKSAGQLFFRLFFNFEPVWCVLMIRCRVCSFWQEHYRNYMLFFSVSLFSEIQTVQSNLSKCPFSSVSRRPWLILFLC